MEAIAVATIGVVGNIGGIFLTHYLNKKDQQFNHYLEKANIANKSNLNGEMTIEVATRGNEKSPISRSAILSFVAGLAGFLLFGLFFLVAVVAGHQAILNIKGSTGSIRGIGLARTGLAMGYLGLVLLIVTLIWLVIRFNR